MRIKNKKKLSSLFVILTYVQTSMDTEVYLDMIRILTGSQKVEVLKVNL